MGFIDGFEDVMQMETKVLQNIMAVLKADYAPQLAALHVALPDVTRIPAVRFDEATRMVSEKYGRAIRDPFDLEPEEEQLISRLFAEEYEMCIRDRSLACPASRGCFSRLRSAL